MHNQFQDNDQLCSVEKMKVLNAVVEVSLGRELGSGGFGTVYDGTYCKRRVAVKKVRPNVKNPTAVRQSFLAETTTPVFRHPNIVRTLAVSGAELTGELLIVMEYAGPRTLKALINDESENICQRRRLAFALDIASALQFIHSHNIVHLDVKPANILVNDQVVCRLGDFGCSQSVIAGENGEISPTSPTGCCLTETLAYRAPELLKGDPATTKADIYSLGICLWQVYTREMPYGNENLFVVIFGVVANHLRPQIPENCHNIEYFNLVRALWRAEASARPSADEVISTLQELQKIRTVILES